MLSGIVKPARLVALGLLLSLPSQAFTDLQIHKSTMFEQAFTSDLYYSLIGLGQDEYPSQPASHEPSANMAASTSFFNGSATVDATVTSTDKLFQSDSTSDKSSLAQLVAALWLSCSLVIGFWGIRKSWGK